MVVVQVHPIEGFAERVILQQFVGIRGEGEELGVVYLAWIVDIHFGEELIMIGAYV